MEGPLLKRSRLENFQLVQGAREATSVRLDEEDDDDVVFISAGPTLRTGTTIKSPAPGRHLPANKRISTQPTSARKQTSAVKLASSSGKKPVPSGVGKRKEVSQSSTVQTSLTDFFQSRNPQPKSLSIYESVEVKFTKTGIDLKDKRDGKSKVSAGQSSVHSEVLTASHPCSPPGNRPVNPTGNFRPVSSSTSKKSPNVDFLPSDVPEIHFDLDQSTEWFAADPGESPADLLHSRAVDEALKLLNAEDESPVDDVKPEYPGEEDDSSGDEFLANLPDAVLLDTAGPSPIPSRLPRATIQQKLVQRQPAFTGPFKNKSGRNCPFYKIMPGTPFSVDAFSFGYVPNVSAYFLSHFHSDHYIGMTNKFQQPVYCSRITANLVKKKIRVDDYWVKEIPMNTPYIVDGVELTLLDANHCPGSCLFLFKLKDGRVYLHTGDFRADPAVLGNDPALKNLRQISKLYLDTTYLDPYYEFESQAATVEFAAEFVQQTVTKNPKTLIVCGTYSVGKEKIFIRIAETLKSKVAVTSYKMEMMKCFEWRDFEAMLTKDWSLAQVHVLPMQALNVPSLQDHLQKFPKYDSLLAVLPSGWQFNKKNTSLRDIKPKVSGAVSILGLPYSEHSSYRELEWFVRLIKPKEVIPTVNVGNPKRRKEMEAILRTWTDPNFKPTPVKKQNLITGFLQT